MSDDNYWIQGNEKYTSIIEQDGLVTMRKILKPIIEKVNRVFLPSGNLCKSILFLICICVTCII